jgi:glycerol-3-phosphate acyltransferase PlsX
MGGDHAPTETVAGAVEAAREDGTTVLLVGPPDAVQAELSKHDVSGLSIVAVPSEGRIEETEQPALALRRKPKASVAVATALVKEGKADAVVSMGSTGALMASAFLALGALEGLERPVLGGPFLGYAPQMVCLDMGANVDARPAQFLDFAAIGVATARAFLGVQAPTVALLNVGSEDTKGSKQAKEAFALLKAAPGLNFIGNVEAHEMVQGKANVVLCDGFVGNMLLKLSEGLGAVIAKDLGMRLFPHVGMDNARSIAMDLFRKISVLDGAGGPILGVNGVVVVGHGRARAPMVRGAIQTAAMLHQRGIVDAVRAELAAMRAKTAQGATAKKK